MSLIWYSKAHPSKLINHNFGTHELNSQGLLFLMKGHVALRGRGGVKRHEEKDQPETDVKENVNKDEGKMYLVNI